MEKYMLILRKNVLYKAPLSALSSVVVFNDKFSDLSSSIENFFDVLSNTKMEFQYDYYSKSKMDSDFCTKQSVSDLTANANYMLKKDVAEKITTLKSIDDVNVWGVKETKHCAGYMLHEYEKIRKIMTKSTEFDAADYIRKPDRNSVVDDNGEITDPSKWY